MNTSLNNVTELVEDIAVYYQSVDFSPYLDVVYPFDGMLGKMHGSGLRAMRFLRNGDNVQARGELVNCAYVEKTFDPSWDLYQRAIFALDAIST